jgi:hypothetical protein
MNFEQSLKEFMAGFEELIDEVDEIAESTLADIMATAYDVLVDHSPIWSGSYVLSHRISVNGSPVAPPVDVSQPDPKGGMYALKIDATTASAYRAKALEEKKVLESAENFSSIEISNDIDYANIVEAIHGAPFAHAITVARLQTEQLSTKSSISGRQKRIKI